MFTQVVNVQTKVIPLGAKTTVVWPWFRPIFCRCWYNQITQDYFTIYIFKLKAYINVNVSFTKLKPTFCRQSHFCNKMIGCRYDVQLCIPSFLHFQGLDAIRGRQILSQGHFDLFLFNFQFLILCSLNSQQMEWDRLYYWDTRKGFLTLTGQDS